MLPGFRFLFAAIALSMSILVFGLGAAALLHAAHEEFASTPSWRAPPETKFAQPSEGPKPVLALLRIEPSPTEQKDSGDAPATTEPTEPSAIVSTPDAQEITTGLANKPKQDDATPAPAETPAPIGDITVAANEAISSPPKQAVPAATEQINTPASVEADATNPALASTEIASTKPTALGCLAVTTELPIASVKPNKSTVKKARRAIRHRKIAPHARGGTNAAATKAATAVRAASSPVRNSCSQALSSPSGQAGPIATGGPSGRPHSAHEPS
jgi:hypothetical protein